LKDRKMNLLLVEDEQSVSNFIRKGFEGEGYSIDPAYDGILGKDFFDKKDYDLVILDVNLPGVNGFVLCKEFKSEKPHLPVILLTALDGLDDKVSGFESGADDYLVKPFEFKELLMRVKALIRRSGIMQMAEKKIVISDL